MILNDCHGKEHSDCHTNSKIITIRGCSQLSLPLTEYNVYDNVIFTEYY